MDSIIKLRNTLDTTNKEIFDLYGKRIDLISKMAQLKSENDCSVWDPRREIELFKKYCQNYGEEYDFIFSQLIEVQAVKFMDYPKWTTALHLEDTSGSLEDFINPILLFVRNSSKYQRLKLKKEFQDKIEGILND